jgi:hypothetical protein
LPPLAPGSGVFSGTEVLFFIGRKLESSNAIYAGTSPRQRVYALLAMLGRAEVQIELGGRRPHTPQATEIAMRCISNGKIMQRAKDDEAQKRVEQGGWYIVTKNDYKRWLARQQQQPIGAPDFADIAGQDLHEAVSASSPLPSE